jgi:hypothetical protein
MKILGIDPGASPALAFLTAPYAGNTVLVLSPRAGKAFDEGDLRRLVLEECPDAAVVEQVGAMPEQGIASTYLFASCWGMIRGVLCGLGIPYTLVTPQTWKKALFTDAERGTHIEDRAKRKVHQKAAASAWVGQHYPGINLYHGARTTRDHNAAEAVMLAHYGIHHVTT